MYLHNTQFRERKINTEKSNKSIFSSFSLVFLYTKFSSPCEGGLTAEDELKFLIWLVLTQFKSLQKRQMPLAEFLTVLKTIFYSFWSTTHFTDSFEWFTF